MPKNENAIKNALCLEKVGEQQLKLFEDSTRGTNFVITRASLVKNGRRELTLAAMEIDQIATYLEMLERPITIRTLTLTNCGISKRHIDNIIELLRKNPTIIQVDLSHNSRVTAKHLMDINKELKDLHPNNSAAGCFSKLGNPLTFFKRTIFGIKIVSVPVKEDNVLENNDMGSGIEL